MILKIIYSVHIHLHMGEMCGHDGATMKSDEILFAHLAHIHVCYSIYENERNLRFR